jgi:hypothetical protein
MADVRAPDYKDKVDEDPTPPPRAPGGRLTPVLEPNEARGGVTHHNMRLVLGISLAAVVVGMVIAYFAFFPLGQGPVGLPPGPPA